MENAMGIGDGERGVFRNGLGLEALLDNDKHDTHIFFFAHWFLHSPLFLSVCVILMLSYLPDTLF
jgi:hypothetical protein